MQAPIAIVGQGCVLPGALDPSALWRLVADGRSALGPAAPARWRVRHPEQAYPDGGPPWHGRGGFVQGFEAAFDPRGLGLREAEVRAFDPALQWLVHAGRTALRGAGHDPLRPSARAGGVFGNLSLPTASLSRWAEGLWLGGRARADLGYLGPDPRPDPHHRFMSGLPAHLAAAALGLGAGAFALDAACASSLYAVKLACDRLRDGEADLMLAGAVSGADPLFLHIGFRALHALSPTGQSRPFHRDADGLLPAEGAACVVLKRLDDALAAGDHILGLIRGVGISNDGGSRGLLAPAEDGQIRAMESAYRAAGMEPEDVSLIECHATGTAAGDATELRSLAHVFAGARAVPIGSLKGNLGHLLTASGLAGVLKVLGAMEAGILPPTLHGDPSLAAVTDTPFRLLAAPERWETAGPRRAAVSSFGFGGCNAHLVVEEWTGDRGAVAPPAARAGVPAAEVAVVGLGVITGDSAGAPDFARILYGEGAMGPSEPGIPLPGLRFPPRDLEHALPQQQLILAAAREALEQSTPVEAAHTGVFVGMQCDAEIARHGARRRLADWVEAWRQAGLPVSNEWLAAAMTAVGPPADAATVLGLLPNIVANRVNRQWGFGGPGFAVSAEQGSGPTALDIAARALRTGELDAAVIAAVDLCREPVHAAAAAQVLPPPLRTPGDAAVALVCKRRTDAERAGDRILALLGGEASGVTWVLGTPSDPLTPRFGHAHAASGLLLVAAAVVACHHRALPAADAGPRPWLSTRRARAVEVRVPTLRGQEAVVRVREAAAAVGVAADPPVPRAPTRRPRQLGELGFVFTGAAAAYAGMGTDLLLAFPDLAEVGVRRLGGSSEDAAWAWEQAAAGEPSPFAKLSAASLLSQVHAELALRVFGLRPQAALGFSSGETNALAALGAWSDLDLGADGLRAIYAQDLGGAFTAVSRAWDLPQGTPVRWAAWRLLHSVDAVRTAVAGEPRVRLTAVHAASDCAIGGDADACAGLIARLGARAFPLAYDLAVHCPEVQQVAAPWRAIHHRPTIAPKGIRFYSGATGAPYVPDADTAADALLAMAVVPLDFPALVRRAWDDGVRVFLELGPRDLCTRWIREALAGREHIAVALDLTGTPALEQAVHAAEALATAGVAVDLEGLADRLTALRPRSAPSDGPRLRFALHPPRVEIPALPEPPARALPVEERANGAVPESDRTEVGRRVSAPEAGSWRAALAAAHLSFLDQQHLAHRRFLEVQAAGWAAFVSAASAAAAPAPVGVPRSERAPAPGPTPRWSGGRFAAPLPPVAPGPTPLPPAAGPAAPAPPVSMPPVPAVAPPAAPTPMPPAPAVAQAPPAAIPPADVPTAAPAPAVVTGGASAPRPSPVSSAPTAPEAASSTTPRPGIATPAPGRTPADRARHRPLGPAPELPDSGLRLGRADLERLAGGPISSVFGPDFAEQDAYRRQVRMPMPPLLLADRVTGLWGAPGGMGRGRVLTETDIPRDAWYLECGRMPPGLMVEAGQSDLLLISWLGADRRNRGQRVYRLLGCELEFHDELPRAGDTLQYDIRVDGHARHGDVRLFFFSYDCAVRGRRLLSVRNGQAGFFSDDELRQSAGVVWDATDARPVGKRLDPPAVRCAKTSFGEEEVAAFAAGDLKRCFGPAFAAGQAHVRTPRIPDGRMQLFERVTRFEPQGGPWGRGYLRAESDLAGDEWFFPGHFKDDPVMPGTLMCQACLQAMAFYLTALGFTLERDGWRFAPVAGEPYRMVCRGQVTPASRHMVYEVFVHEVWSGPEPSLFADLLLTVDGHKVFHGERMGLRLVPDWPLTSRPDLLPDPAVRRRTPGGAGLDEAAVLACAWGRPSEAFGARFAPFDGPRRLPRLPGPPYLLMTRVRHVEGEGAGAWAEVEYDVPGDAWYFRESGTGAMPFCVLLEAALQPCGWLTAHLGIPLGSARDLHFRNLDGTAAILGEVRPDAGTLTTRAEVRSVSRAGATVIEGFHVRCTCRGETVFEMDTVFGHFTSDALGQQSGLPGPDRGADGEPSIDGDVEAAVADGASGSPLLASGSLRMLDRLTGWWPHGGRAGLGRVRAEKRVNPGQWYFRAHFFQDPVQPGSLGLEAMVQLLQVFMLRSGLAEGVPDPRFVPLAKGESLTWKYRGQVAPTDGEIAVELEITSIERGPVGPLARADGWLSVDGRAIYHARGLAMRIVPGRDPQDGAIPERAPADVGQGQPLAGAGSVSTGAVDLQALRRHWRAQLGTGAWVGEDVQIALIQRYVRRFAFTDPAAADRVYGRPVLYCANHQTGIESMLFGALAPVLQGTLVVALAKAEHRESWLGGLIAELARHPGARMPESLVFFDRTDPRALLELLESLRLRLQGGASVLVHVEGTRALSCRQPITRMSANLVDLALAADVPIVPVRFSGGLPVRPAPQRLEFPVGHTGQDYQLGAPVRPESLRPMPLAQRTQAVLDAIRATGPAPEAEVPGAPDASFGAAVAAHVARTGAAEGDAVILQALRAGLPDTCRETRLIVGGLDAGGLVVPGEPLGPWLAGFARRLYGPGGPPVSGGESSA